MKRIGFIINRMNFRPSSGHGIFIKGAIEILLSEGHFVDVICDGEPEDNFFKNYPINVYTPEIRHSYTLHNDLFQFGDSFNFEKAINFRNAINKALTHHIYDTLICNDTESAFTCYQLGLHEYINVCHYAHECVSINRELGEEVFKNCYYDLIEQMMFFPITTLVQTEANKIKLEQNLNKQNANLYVLPYPISDSTPITVDTREGILYIGRYEERKNPGALMRVLADIKNKYNVEPKVKILTRAAHVKKFERDLAEINYSNYEIKFDIVGEEKAKLIQSCNVAFMPYKNESFGIAVMEALRFMPTIVLDKYDWHYNFHGMSNLLVKPLKQCADVIWDVYNNFTVNEQKVIEEFQTYQRECKSALLKLIENDKAIRSFKTDTEPRFKLYIYLNDTAGKWISLYDWYKQTAFLRNQFRGFLYINNDVEIIYKNSQFYKIHQTKEATYLGIPDDDGNISFVEKLEESKQSEAFNSFFQ